MAVLSSADRKALPASDFAGPNRSYPMPDRAHAIAAESYSARFASPALHKAIVARAHREFGLGEKKSALMKALG